MLQKNFRLEVKSVEDDGTFSGYASVTGNIDSDNEIIDKGAFKRTLDHTKGVVPILWQHDRKSPVGWNVSAQEDGKGLAVTGKLMVDTELGRYAQSFLKTGLEVGANPGLSIGFVVPKGGDYVKDGRRHFKEVALKEYSIATFQSNPEAIVTTAKEEEEKDSAEKTAEHETQSDLSQEKSKIESALSSSVQSVLSDESLSDDQKTSKVTEAYAQYAEAMGAWHGKFIASDSDVDAAEEDMDGKEIKSGRAISQTTHKAMLEIAKHLKDASEMHAKAGELHSKAIGDLQDLAFRGYTASDVNAPHPVGQGANPKPYAGWNPAGGGKAENVEAEEKSEATAVPAEDSDPDILHSLLALSARFTPASKQ